MNRRHHLDNEKIIKLWRRGLTIREIAAELKCSTSTLNKHLSREGIKMGRNDHCEHRKTDSDCDTCPYIDCIATTKQVVEWSQDAEEMEAQ